MRYLTEAGTVVYAAKGGNDRKVFLCGSSAYIAP
jgi:hypothetical protein